LFDSFNPKPAL